MKEKEGREKEAREKELWEKEERKGKLNSRHLLNVFQGLGYPESFV